jgi:hypothetical protein
MATTNHLVQVELALDVVRKDIKREIVRIKMKDRKEHTNKEKVMVQ